MNIITVVKQDLFSSANFRLMGQRYKGGGGGRPGGKPAFNWKEKKLLNLTTFRKPVGMPPAGNFKLISKHFDESQGDFKFSLSGKTTTNVGTISSIEQLNKELNTNSRKKVNLSLLFGSSKSYGLLQFDENKKRPDFRTRNSQK